MYEEKAIKYQKRKKVKTFNLKNKTAIKIPEFVNRIKWKELMTKLSILIFIMILIIFIISRINKNTKEKQLILNNNINMVTEATLKFYNKENLPQNNGDSTSLLLDEIIKKNNINIIKDSSGKECDYINSYTIITKINNNSYRLKIHLTCPKEQTTIEKELICETNCQIKK